jgi:hypothetical protein
MTAVTTTPWWRAVAAQARLLWHDGRWAAPQVALALSVIIVHLPGVELNGEENGHVAPFPLLLRVYVVWLICVVLWASLVWRGERPGERDDLHDVPLPRGAQDLARVAAGGAWLVLALACGGLSLVLLRRTDVLADATPWVAAAFAAGTLLLYLVVSALALVVRRPALLTFTTVVAWATLASVVARSGAPGLADRLSAGPFGILAALVTALEPEIHGSRVTAVHGAGRWLAWIAGWLTAALLAVCAPAIGEAMRSRRARSPSTEDTR